VPSLAQLIADFRTHLESEDRSPCCTLSAYGVDLRCFQQFLADRQLPEDVSAWDVRTLRRFQEWMTAKGLAQGTRVRRLRAVSSFLTWCEVEEYIARNPARKMRIPKPHDTLPEPVSEARATDRSQQPRAPGSIYKRNPDRIRCRLWS